MTIAILVRNLTVGGIQRLAVDDANELQKRGHEVFIIHFEAESVDDSMREHLSIPSENIIYVPYKRMRDLYAFRSLVRILWQLRPDLVITHQWFANTVGRLAALLAGMRTTLSFEHSTDDFRKPGRQLRLDRLLQHLCRRVIAVSPSVRESLLRTGIKDSRITVIPNAIDLTRYEEKRNPGPGNRFVFIGRLVRDKGADIAIHAVARVPGIELAIIGDGPDRASLETLASELGVLERVHFVGTSHDTPNILKETDALVLPSRREGFGLVALEALASGVPVIASETVARNGLITDKVNGLVVPNDNEEALAAALEIFANDAALRTALGSHTRDGIERYGMPAHADSLLSFVSEKESADIQYVANIRMPTEMAHGIQIMEACAAFVRAGKKVELIVPDRYTPVHESPFFYYGIEDRFPIRRVFTFDTVRWGRSGFLFHTLHFALRARFALKRRALVYSRDEVVLLVLSILGVRGFVWESHDGAWGRAARFIAKRAKKVVVVSDGARVFYIEKGIPADRIVAVANGVDVAAFRNAESTESARAQFGIPHGRPVALYAGRLDGWKGTNTLFEAARLLPDVEFVIAGGEDAQVAELKQRYPSLRFLGHRPYRELPNLLAAADILILPNTAKSAVSLTFTSPLKLLAYLASGKPIVASDLPSVREIAGEAALYVAPDDAEALAAGIRQVLENDSIARTISNAAQERAQAYTWDARASRILAALPQASVSLDGNKQTRVLAIYRGKLTENRGTPIRVRSLLERIAAMPGFTLTVASWDEELPFPATHIPLSNKKLDDVHALFAAVRDDQIDVIIGHTMATWYYLLMLRLFTRIPVALEMHGFIEIEAHFYGSISTLRARIEGFVYRLFYPLMDLITTCSENAAEILAKVNRNVVPIYGGVDTEMFRPDVVPLDIPRAPGTILIGYAGNTRKWQGVPFLLDAFKELHQEDSSFLLAFLGSEKELPEGEGIIPIAGVPHNQVPAFLAACDILVIPRLDDEVSRISFPSKLPEYLAMGKPVVASATSDAHRAIEDGVDGFVFPPGDRPAFLRILHTLKDPDLRKKLGTAARESALTRYQWDNQAVILATRLRNLVHPHV